MPKKLPLLHLEQGLYLQVDGEDEKDHTINWETLKRIGDNTQRLLNKLALYSLEGNTLEPHEIAFNFAGFYPGSAIPEFRINQKPQGNLFATNREIKQLNGEFSFIVGHLSDGNFQAIADRFSEPTIKNDIIDAVTAFSNSAGTKPFVVVKPTTSKKYVNGFRPLAKLRNITPTHNDMLKVKIDKLRLVLDQPPPVEAVSKILIKTSPKGRKSTKIGQFYTNKEAALSLKFDSIETDERIYVLRSEVHFSIEEGKKTVSLESGMLDIFATGKDMPEAQKDMFEQFDYTFRRLNEIEDAKLSSHLLNAKKFINLLVEKVKNK